MTDLRSGFFCKSFAPDFDHLTILLDSFRQHNPDLLRLTLSLPCEDLGAFHHRFGTDWPEIELVEDESYCDHNLSRFLGWHGQQICKFMSWNATDCDHYAVLDSDCYFIKDVRAQDLVPAKGKDYVVCGSSIRTVVKDDNIDLISYINGDLVPSEQTFPEPPASKKCDIFNYIHYKDMSVDDPDAITRSSFPFKIFNAGRWMFYQPGQIFSRQLLIELKTFLDGYGLTFGDCILISPWEYNWYGEYAAFAAHAQCDFRVSPFLHFQDEAGVAFGRAHGMSYEQLSKRFMFVQMAARHLADLRYV